MAAYLLVIISLVQTKNLYFQGSQIRKSMTNGWQKGAKRKILKFVILLFSCHPFWVFNSEFRNTEMLRFNSKFGNSFEMNFPADFFFNSVQLNAISRQCKQLSILKAGQREYQIIRQFIRQYQLISEVYFLHEASRPSVGPSRIGAVFLAKFAEKVRKLHFHTPITAQSMAKHLLRKYICKRVQTLKGDLENSTQLQHF